jgi:hypothetical protein
MIKNSFPHLNPRQIAHLLDSFRPDEYLHLSPLPVCRHGLTRRLLALPPLRSMDSKRTPKESFSLLNRMVHTPPPNKHSVHLAAMPD